MNQDLAFKEIWEDIIAGESASTAAAITRQYWERERRGRFVVVVEYTGEPPHSCGEIVTLSPITRRGKTQHVKVKIVDDNGRRLIGRPIK